MKKINLIFLIFFLLFLQCRKENEYINNNDSEDNITLEEEDKILFISFVLNACECTREKSLAMEEELNSILKNNNIKKIEYEKIEYMEKHDIARKYLDLSNIYFPPVVIVIANNKILFKTGELSELNKISNILGTIIN